MTLFGINGVRGKVNSELTAETALQIGRAVGKTYGKRIAVAVDARDSGEMLRAALSSGIMAAGSDVVCIGMLPVPAMQSYVRTHDDITGGVMITASHNPSEYNGFKFIGPDGMEVASEDEASLAGFCATEISDAEWAETGEMFHDGAAASDYVEDVVSHVDAESVRKAGLKACVCLFNGASCATVPSILKSLGVTAFTLDADPGSGKVGESSELTEEHLSLLMTMVRETGSDIGVAMDSDGDRAMFIGSDGSFIDGDLSLAVMAGYMLKARPGKVVTPVSSSKIVEDTVEEAGGLLKYTAVGSHTVVRKIFENKAVFGGEENGGMVFPEFQCCRDGGMAMAKMLECVAAGGPLEKQVEGLRRYTTVKGRVDCPDALKKGLLNRFVQELSDQRTDITDGVKVLFDDGWVLLRPSTTEECFRIYSESSDPEKADERAKLYSEEAVRYLAEMKG